MAHCVWWLASVTGLEQGLVVHMDNLRKQSKLLLVKDRELSAGSATSMQERRQSSSIAISRQAGGISSVPRDIQEESRVINDKRNIHPDRVHQVQDTNIDVSDLDLDSSGNE